MPSIPPRFYVYVLCRPDGSVFYVGKGAGRRVFQHRPEARRNCACHKCRVIRKVWQSGGDIHHQIVFQTDDEQAAFDHEIALIAMYGRDTLANGTDGGEGLRGHVFTPEHRARIGAHGRGRSPSQGIRDQIAASLRGQRLSPETRAKISAAGKGRKQSAEHVTKRAIQQIGRKARPETRAKISKVASARTYSAETRAKISEAGRRRQGEKRSPEARAKMSAAKRAMTPEARERWTAAVSVARKQRITKPETREKLSAAQRAIWARKRAASGETEHEN